tara:strand:+ start:103 stop:495 length:393 start_codon:yes stop_codon:yes gene_type:complete
MGNSKRVGRPKLSHWGMTQLYIRLAAYMETKITKDGKVKSNITSYNAFTQLTESKHWKGIVEEIYKRSPNKAYYINRLLDDKDKKSKDKFYTNNVQRRGKDAFVNTILKSTKHTHRKKRSNKELSIRLKK